jgi:hypothetical protein
MSDISNVSIILTTCVNVQKKSYLYQTDKQSRVDTYLKAIKQWLELTNFKLIIVENTGYTFPELSNYLDNKRLEIISFVEADIKEANYLKYDTSKGSSELFSIYYAFKHSNIIKHTNFIIKITGRFYIPDLEKYLTTINIHNYDALTQNNNARCEMVGSHINNFNYIFNMYPIDMNSRYCDYIETVYMQRCAVYDKVLQCPVFPIEPTQRGGVDMIYTNI